MNGFEHRSATRAASVSSQTMTPKSSVDPPEGVAFLIRSKSAEIVALRPFIKSRLSAASLFIPVRLDEISETGLLLVFMRAFGRRAICLGMIVLGMIVGCEWDQLSNRSAATISVVRVTDPGDRSPH